MARQIVYLHKRILSEHLEIDDPAVVAELEMWNLAYTHTEDPSAAWTVVIALLLRSPDFVIY